MNNEFVKTEKKGDIGILSLVAKTNILSPKVQGYIGEALDALEADDSVKVIIFTGNGAKSFIAGADIKTMQNLDGPGAVNFITNLHKLINKIRQSHKIVVCAINGHCFGAGFELAISCDYVVCADNATFGMQEVALGIPSVIEAALFPFVCSLAKMREWLLFGEVFGAQEAYENGVINKLVKPEALMAEAMQAAERFASKPIHALKLQKQLMNRWLENAGVDASVKNGIDFFGNSFGYPLTQSMLAHAFDKKH